MRVLITGAAGYVGSVCAEVMVARGHKVIGLDSLGEGHRAAVPPECDFHQIDLLDSPRLDQLFRTEKIDAVMHFAALSVVEKSTREPSEFFRVNVAGGIILLDAMVRNSVNRLIFSSSAAVYGQPEQTPIVEDCPKSPINPYGETKLVFENILADYGRYTGMKHVSLRYFNAAGASRDRGEAHRMETHLIPRVLEAAAGKREYFEVRGEDYPTPDGTCIRDYIHVVDIADAHVLALEMLDRVSGEALNVGTNRGHSVREVLETARRVTKRPIPAKIAPRRPGDPATLIASGEKIQRTLGWTPRFSTLEFIIQSAWNWKERYPLGYAQT
ncbi:MAG TPA: UDP-glucose 4-epimerase GalE [Candidatus Acidoferrum sp.]|nr:UDP-glucose 4-epimerase GalE [Candidatus Acidoferrum sp.]